MGAQVLEETVTDNETKVAAKASTVLVEKRDGRVVDFDPINIISAIKSAFGDLNKALHRPRQNRGHPESRGARPH